MVKSKRFLVSIFAVIMLFIAAYMAVYSDFVAYAAAPTEDGIYSVSVSNDLPAMADPYVPHEATLEKSGSFCYLTLTFGSEQLSDVKLKQVGGKTVGTETKTDNSGTTFTYTFSEANILSALTFSGTVKAMNMTVDFTLTPDINGATRTGDYTRTDERPAEYMPDIVTSAGTSYTAEKGSVFTIPTATATLGDESCAVTTSVTYNGEAVEKDNENQFTLANAGEYTLTYRATNASYETNLGNDSFAEYTVKITSKVGATTLAKVEDTGNILGENVALQASEITEGSVYETAKTAMKTVADNYRVVSVELFDGDGKAVTLTDSIILKIQPADTFDRTETKVYYMDGSGNLSEISCSPYGRYVSFEMDKTGTFILSYGGVAFHMPMWGYLLICIGAVLIIAAGVTAMVILVKKKKRQSARFEKAFEYKQI